MRYSPLNITTVVMLAFTLFIAFSRLRRSTDANLPLFYYLVTFCFSVWAPDILYPESIFAGAVCALLLRFEFLAGWLSWLVRVSELIVLSSLAHTLYSSAVW